MVINWGNAVLAHWRGGLIARIARLTEPTLPRSDPSIPFGVPGVG